MPIIRTCQPVEISNNTGFQEQKKAPKPYFVKLVYSNAGVTMVVVQPDGNVKRNSAIVTLSEKGTVLIHEGITAEQNIIDLDNLKAPKLKIAYDEYEAKYNYHSPQPRLYVSGLTPAHELEDERVVNPWDYNAPELEDEWQRELDHAAEMEEDEENRHFQFDAPDINEPFMEQRHDLNQIREEVLRQHIENVNRVLEERARIQANQVREERIWPNPNDRVV